MVLRAILAPVRRISIGVLALRTSSCRLSVCAASCASLTVRADSGRFGFTSRAMTAALGTSSCSSPSPLPLRRGPKKLTPEINMAFATLRQRRAAARLPVAWGSNPMKGELE
jgi:hypothetical protein